MVVDYSQPPKMVPFNGANCLDWVLQVDRYFFCYFVPDSLKLSLASLFIEGESREWFCPLYRNHIFQDWDHFVDELFIRFRHLDSRNPCSNVVVSQCKTREVTERAIDGDLLKEHFNNVDAPEVLPSLLENPIGTSSNCAPFTHLVVSLSCIESSDNPLEPGYTMEKFSKNSVCKVFSEMTNREIAMDVENSINAISASNHKSREMVDKKTDSEHHPTPFGFTDDSTNIIYLMPVIDFPFDPGLLKLNHIVDAYKRVPTNRNDNWKQCALLLISDFSKANHGAKVAKNAYKNSEVELITVGGEDPINEFIGTVPLWRGLAVSIFHNLVMFDTTNSLDSGLGKSLCNIATIFTNQRVLSHFPFDPGAMLYLVTPACLAFVVSLRDSRITVMSKPELWVIVLYYTLGEYINISSFANKTNGLEISCLSLKLIKGDCVILRVARSTRNNSTCVRAKQFRCIGNISGPTTMCLHDNVWILFQFVKIDNVSDPRVLGPSLKMFLGFHVLVYIEEPFSDPNLFMICLVLPWNFMYSEVLLSLYVWDPGISSKTLLQNPNNALVLLDSIVIVAPRLIYFCNHVDMRTPQKEWLTRTSRRLIVFPYVEYLCTGKNSIMMIGKTLYVKIVGPFSYEIYKWVLLVYHRSILNYFYPDSWRSMVLRTFSDDRAPTIHLVRVGLSTCLWWIDVLHFADR